MSLIYTIYPGWIAADATYLDHLVLAYLSWLSLAPQCKVELARMLPLVIPSHEYFSLPRISTISISPELGQSPYELSVGKSHNAI